MNPASVLNDGLSVARCPICGLREDDTHRLRVANPIDGGYDAERRAFEVAQIERMEGRDGQFADAVLWPTRALAFEIFVLDARVAHYDAAHGAHARSVA